MGRSTPSCTSRSLGTLQLHDLHDIPTCLCEGGGTAQVAERRGRACQQLPCSGRPMYED